MSCSSASHAVPRCRSSAASPLSICRPRVSPGSKSLSRKPLPLVMRYGATYFPMRSRTSCLGMNSGYFCLGRNVSVLARQPRFEGRLLSLIYCGQCDDGRSYGVAFGDLRADLQLGFIAFDLPLGNFFVASELE